jgi:hypothetical protein
MLRIEILQDHPAGTIQQCAKARALAAVFGVEGERRATPMTQVAQADRLAAYNSAPTDAHFAAMLDVIRYVISTAERGITYGHSTVPVAIWCDANFAGYPDTRRSVSGWVMVCFGSAVSWESCEQPTTAVSTIDAEYQVCGSVAREAMSLRKLLCGFSVLCQEIWPWEASVVMCDKKAAESLCCDRKETKRAKHIDIVHHFSRDWVASDGLKLVFCKSKETVSDCLTKALPRPLLEVGLSGQGNLCDSSDW